MIKVHIDIFDTIQDNLQNIMYDKITYVMLHMNVYQMMYQIHISTSRLQIFFKESIALMKTAKLNTAHKQIEMSTQG